VCIPITRVKQSVHENGSIVYPISGDFEKGVNGFILGTGKY